MVKKNIKNIRMSKPFKALKLIALPVHRSVLWTRPLRGERVKILIFSLLGIEVLYLVS